MGEQRGFSKATAICFTVNYVVGTGFLTVPWAFQTGGIILSTLTMAIVILICNMTKNYVLESMAIAEELVREHVVEEVDETDLTKTTEEECSIITTDHRRGTDYGATFEEAIGHTTPAEVYAHNHDYEEVHQEAEPLSIGHTTPAEVYAHNHDYQEAEPPPEPMYFLEAGEDTSFDSSSSELSRLIVKDRKFEITALCRLFLGEVGEKAYITSIALDIYGCLWGFTSVFASSLALAVPIVHNFNEDYAIYTLLYAIIVIPLSCLELREQITFQVLYSVCRFVVMVVMIITTLVAVDDENRVYFSDMVDGPGEQTKMIKWGGFYKMFSVLVFTAIFHAAIPVLSQPVADKRTLNGIFLDTFLLTGALFWLLGYSVTSYFGKDVEQSANLNWSTYVGGTGGPSSDNPDTWTNVAIWARMISGFVVCFPAINVISSFPLNAVALGNNLMAAVFGKAVHEAERNRKLVIMFRLVSSLPPLVGALFVKDLGIITAWTGIVAIATAFPIPALLYIGSIKFAFAHGMYKYETYYDGFGSSIGFAWAVVAFSVFAMICITKTLIAG